MALIRWSREENAPAFPSEMFGMQREINRMFDGFFRTGWHAGSDLAQSVWSPATDIVEHDNEFVVKVELPGLSKEDVRVAIQDNMLTVSGEKKEETVEEKSNYHRVERSYGTFQRCFTLGEAVRGDKIDASFKDGILTITLLKAEEAKKKQIDVKVR
ncbi:MAG: Hsp20/alpha crystallin family protein [Bacteroidota bacterium]